MGQISVQEFQKRLDDILELSTLKGELIKKLEEKNTLLEQTNKVLNDYVSILRGHIAKLTEQLEKSMSQTDQVIEIAEAASKH